MLNEILFAIDKMKSKSKKPIILVIISLYITIMAYELKSSSHMQRA